MKSIEPLYKPFNFSGTKCFVIKLNIKGNGIYKIDSRLPAEIKTITGIVIVPSLIREQTVIGHLTLSLHEGTNIFYSHPVSPVSEQGDYSSPLMLHLPVRGLCSLKGIYNVNFQNEVLSHSLSIYIHYTL